MNTSDTSFTKCSFSSCQFFVKWSLFLSGLFIPNERVCPISIAWDSICLFNSRILLSARSALYSCIRISDVASASNRSFGFSRRLLIRSLSNSWLDFLFCENNATGFAVLAKIYCAPGNKLSSSECLLNLRRARICSSLLNVQWWSQRIPDVLVAKVIFGCNARALEDWSRTFCIVEVVGHVGLATCVRCCCSQTATVLMSWYRSGIIVQQCCRRGWGRQKRGICQKRWRVKARERQRTLTWHHGWYANGVNAQRHLKPQCECARGQILSRKRKSRVKCVCLHTPSVSVDRYRL